jgi:hypothetical protein
LIGERAGFRNLAIERFDLTGPGPAPSDFDSQRDQVSVSAHGPLLPVDHFAGALGDPHRQVFAFALPEFRARLGNGPIGGPVVGIAGL